MDRSWYLCLYLLFVEDLQCKDLQCKPVIEEVINVPLLLCSGDLFEDGVGQEAGGGHVDSSN